MITSRHKKLARRKQRIARRLAPRNWTAQTQPMYRGTNVHYEHAERVRALDTGGIGAIHRLATTQTTALSLGSNTFTATQTIGTGNLEVSTGNVLIDAGNLQVSSGNASVSGTLSAQALALPTTQNSTSGVVTLNSQPFLHAYTPVNAFYMSPDKTDTFVGIQAGNFSMTDTMQLMEVYGGGHVGVGYQALKALTTGYYNSAVGYQALAANTSGAYNTAAGYQALTANTLGGQNTVVGTSALVSNTTGGANTAVGVSSLAGNNGGDNTAVGVLSLSAPNLTGNENTAIGFGSLWLATSGSNNVGLGSTTGYYLTSGSNNTFLGYMAGMPQGDGAISNASAIGANATVAQSNAMVLGGTGANAVNVGIGTTAPDTTLQVFGDIKVGTAGTNGCLKNYGGNVIAGTCSSDLRLKKDVQPFGSVLGKVAQLRPVHFTWRADEFPDRHFGNSVNSGLIAQDVEKLFPELVTTDHQGFKMVNYSELPYLTLAAVKELKAEDDELRAESQRLRADNAALKAQLSALAERLERLEQRKQ